MDAPTPAALRRLLQRRTVKAKQNALKQLAEDWERFEDQAMEAQEVLTLLPAELWKQVLILIDPPDPWNNRINSYPSNFQLVEPRARDILFSRVIQIPEFQCQMGVQLLLKLRHVSKKLRDAVDYCFEINAEQRALAGSDSLLLPEHVSICPMLHIKGPFLGDQMPVLERIISNFNPNDDDESCAKRFLGKSLHLTIEEIDDFDPMDYFAYMNQFATTLGQLLRLICDQIWFFAFNPGPPIDHPFRIMDSYLVVFLQSLGEMCNLKILEVFVYGSGSSDARYMEPVVQSLHTSLWLMTIPILLKLDKVLLKKSHDGLIDHLHPELFLPNFNLKQLYFSGRCLQSVKRPFQTIVVKKMHILPLEKFGCDGSLEDILEFISKDWNLSDIDLTLSGECNMNELFEILEHYENLKRVKLTVAGTKVKGSGKDLFLKLSFLSRFELHLNDNGENHAYIALSVDYLLYAPVLQEIVWINRALFEAEKAGKEVAARKEELISFNGGRDLCDSNVWKLLPCLRSIQVLDCSAEEMSRSKIYKRSGGTPTVRYLF